MLPAQSIRPGSTIQLVPYIPYGGDWTEKEQIKPGVVMKVHQFINTVYSGINFRELINDAKISWLIVLFCFLQDSD